MTHPELVPEPVVTPAVTPDDLTLLDQFEATTLAADAFGHREHVRVGWTCLQLPRMALPKFAANRALNKMSS